tara:strand:+ start:1472 stop:2254 length:783 start_codon:yes stop_codon:yes gene_type:complete
MSFSPVLPTTGISGWLFLNRTLDAQTQAFNTSANNQRDINYFQKELPKITSIEELVDNHRLLRVALGSVGLSADIKNKAFIKKVIASDLQDPKSLANRLSDMRYKRLASAFGALGAKQPINSQSIDQAANKYLRLSFEAALGKKDNTMRLALYAKRELAELALEKSSDRTKFYKILGSPQLRELFETYLRLPKGFARLDLEKQVEVFQSKIDSRFGFASISKFSEIKNQNKLIEGYLFQSELNTGAAMTSQDISLMLLRS